MSTHSMYRVFIKYCVFFSRILESLPPFPRQHTAAIGCTKKLLANMSDCTYTHTVLTALKLSYSDVGEGGVAVNCETNTIFPEHPV